MTKEVRIPRYVVPCDSRLHLARCSRTLKRVILMPQTCRLPAATSRALCTGTLLLIAALTKPGGLARAANSGSDEAIRQSWNSWNAPFKPFRIIGNIYYVGATGVSSFLITTPQGHILIDTGFEMTVPRIT